MSKESQFHEALELSRQMLEVGRSQKWERLIALEGERQKLLRSISVARTDAHLLPVLQEIKRCDDELRERLEAWMKHAKILLRET